MEVKKVYGLPPQKGPRREKKERGERRKREKEPKKYVWLWGGC